jgi:DNA-binding MarR family transcriptional regulator
MQESELLTTALKEFAELFSHRSMGGFFHFAKKKELSPYQMGTLMRINRGGKHGIMHMGSEMSKTGAASSQMIDRLVQQGFVERREDPADRRTRQITLTASGERIVQECREARERWLTELASRMSAEEADLVIGALRILSQKMRELDEDDPHPNHNTDKESRVR